MKSGGSIDDRRHRLPALEPARAGRGRRPPARPSPPAPAGGRPTLSSAVAIERPVARPSSTTTTVRPASQPAGARRAATAPGRAPVASADPRARPAGRPGRLNPSSLTAPSAYSRWRGWPTLRTTSTSSGARSAAATSAATGTPPRARPSTTRSPSSGGQRLRQALPGLGAVGERAVGGHGVTVPGPRVAARRAHRQPRRYRPGPHERTAAGLPRRLGRPGPGPRRRRHVRQPGAGPRARAARPVAARASRHRGGDRRRVRGHGRRGARTGRGQQRERQPGRRRSGAAHSSPGARPRAVRPVAATSATCWPRPTRWARSAPTSTGSSPARTIVLDAIDKGRARGAGTMPADIVQGQDAEDVADFVAAVAGKQ